MLRKLSMTADFDNQLGYFSLLFTSQNLIYYQRVEQSGYVA